MLWLRRPPQTWPPRRRSTIFGMVRAVVHRSYAVHHINSPGCPKLLQHTYTYGEDEDGPYLRITTHKRTRHTCACTSMTHTTGVVATCGNTILKSTAPCERKPRKHNRGFPSTDRRRGLERPKTRPLRRTFPTYVVCCVCGSWRPGPARDRSRAATNRSRWHSHAPPFRAIPAKDRSLAATDRKPRGRDIEGRSHPHAGPLMPRPVSLAPGLSPPRTGGHFRDDAPH